MFDNEQELSRANVIKELKDLIGDQLRLNREYRAWKKYFDGLTDQDMKDLGWTDEEIATAKSAFGDLSDLADVCEGVGKDRDYMSFARRINPRSKK